MMIPAGLSTKLATRRVTCASGPKDDRGAVASPANIKTASMQTSTETRLISADCQGLSGSMNPGVTKSQLSCIWIIRSIRDGVFWMLPVIWKC